METIKEIVITEARGKPHIEKISFTKDAKSLSEGHDWDNVQGLSVIIGRNGVGKTHLLKYIDRTLEKYQPHSSKFKHTLISARPSKMQSSHKDKPINLNQAGKNLLVQQIKDAFKGKISQFYKKKTGLSILADEWAKSLNSQISKQNAEKIIYRLIELKYPVLPSDEEIIQDVIDYTLENTVISNHSIQIFEQYINSNRQKQSDEIDKINFILKKYKSDWELKLDQSNSICLKKNSAVNTVGIGDLSMGERVLLEIFLWLYILEHSGYPSNVKPTIMLLDEPDSHLDPNLVEIFFKIIHEKFVIDNKIQVIFVTHRPDTVALAPPKTIFYLERDKNDNKPKIVPIHRMRAMFRLTPNLRTITNFYFEVYAESHTDAHFYEGVYHSLLIHTNKKRKMQNQKKYYLLSRRYQLNFIPVNPANLENSKKKFQGGCSEIKKCLGRDRNCVKANSIPVIYQELQNLIHIDPEFYISFGILDNDNEKEKKMKDLKEDEFDEYIAIPDERHSLENFTLDPFIFCFVLTEEEIKDFIDFSSISDYDTKEKFKSLCKNIKQTDLKLNADQTFLQKQLDDYFRIIFKTILEKDNQSPTKSKNKLENNPLESVQTRLDDGDFCNTTVEIIVDIQKELKFKYPKELLTLKGHDLADGFIGKKFRLNGEDGKPIYTNVAKLRDVITEKIKRNGIPYIPQDLANVFFDLNEKVRAHVHKIIKRDI